MQTLEQACAQTETDLTDLRQQLADLDKQMEDNAQFLVQVQKDGERQAQKCQALAELTKAYQRYLQDSQEESWRQAEAAKLQQNLTTNLAGQQKLLTQHGQLEEARRFWQGEMQTKQQKLQQYSHFEPRPLLKKDLEDMESAFRAMSQKISFKRQQLEQYIAKDKERFDRIDKALLEHSKKNGLISSDYETVIYDSYQMESLKDAQAQLQLAMEKVRKQQNHCQITLGKLDTRLAYEQKNLQEKLGFTEPKARELVVIADFDQLLAQKRHQWQAVDDKRQKLAKRQGMYQENLSALAEFGQLTLDLSEAENIRADLTAMDNVALERYRGQLVRDYRSMGESKRDAREKLGRLTDDMRHLKRYQEDFFLKPLTTLAELTAKPKDFLMQLGVTLTSYEQLLQKMAVDIALIEQEKEKIQAMFLRYLADVHNQLGLIDKNSTIHVKGQTLKMLRINLPAWADNEAIYTAKLKAYLENLTAECLALLTANQNIEDLLSRQIALRRLYDEVVGIASIEIKLYKIEAQREYLIHWADVARNSGGEGFLSAFVVLSSLLSFLRRKESDLFGEREESKVLVMDNPFAKTNAAHLLMPMMDMAKKTRTQLICLSGIGGDAIYGRFDNIYVLTLSQSNLQRDLSYLHGKLVKGEALNSAHIQTETMEQIDLF